MDLPVVDHFRCIAGTVCLGTTGAHNRIRFHHHYLLLKTG